jgi:hypothetical protein
MRPSVARVASSIAVQSPGSLLLLLMLLILLLL